MNIRFLLPLFSLLLCALPVRATVYIYQGTVNRFDTGEAVPVSSMKCYIAVDLDAKQVAILQYGKVDGVKMRDVGSTFTVLPVKFTRADGKTQYAFATVSTTDFVGTVIGHSAVFLRGTEKTLVVRRAGGQDITLPGPKSLGGTHRITSLGAVVENNFSVAYDEVRSVPANNAMKSLAAVVVDLKAELDARGFTP